MRKVNAINYLNVTLKRMWPKLKFHKLEHTTATRDFRPVGKGVLCVPVSRCRQDENTCHLALK